MYKIAILLCMIPFAVGCVAPSPRIAMAPPATQADTFESINTLKDDQIKAQQPPQKSVFTAPAPEKKDIQKKSAKASSPKKNDAQQILDEALSTCQFAQEFWQKGELESAIKALDQAYSLMLSVNAENAPDLLQQKEDLRYMISRRMLEIYASRFTVATGNHNAIPLVMNKYVKQEIALLTGRERNFFIDSYRRSGIYRPQIIKALTEAGLPEELSWLPLIESGFKVRALSRARALGMWQFIASTGYKFGLSRDRYIDERMDPKKSTEAAIAYLKELHQIFGDWVTCLAAYNCGEGRVLRVIRRQNVNYLDNFWDLYQLLPRETARYVPRFMATLHIINDPQKYGMDLGEPDPPLEYETAAITRQVHLKNVAMTIQIPESTLKTLNPELRYQITPATAYALKVPIGTGSLVLANIDKISKYEFPKNAYVFHRIRRGESLSLIAKKYRSSVRRIMQANGLRTSRIVAGKTLKIPMGRASALASSGSKTVSSAPATHVVRRGDSLWNIARRYGTTISKIQKTNKLKTTRLSIGQVLHIPGSKKASSSTVYVVRSGDTAAKIAQKHGMNLSGFLSLNGLGMKSTIYPGQRLSVK